MKYITYADLKNQYGLPRNKVDKLCNILGITIHVLSEGYRVGKPPSGIKIKDVEKLLNYDDDDGKRGKIALRHIAKELKVHRNTVTKWCEDLSIKSVKGKINNRICDVVTSEEATVLRSYTPPKREKTSFCSNSAGVSFNRTVGLYTRIQEDYVPPRYYHMIKDLPETSLVPHIENTKTTQPYIW